MPQEEQNGNGKGGKCVSQHPPKMRKDICEITGKHGSFQLHGVNEGKGIRYCFERAAYELKVKPSARQPSGKIGEQCAAYAADLLIVQNATEQQAERDKKDRDRHDKKDGNENIDRNGKTEQDSHDIANNTLRYGKRNDGKGITEYKIYGRERCGI